METNGWHDNTHSLFALQAAMRRTFQRTQEFCDEAQKYMDLVAQEEADARRPGTAGLEIGIGWWLFVWLVFGMFDFTFSVFEMCFDCQGSGSKAKASRKVPISDMCLYCNEA